CYEVTENVLHVLYRELYAARIFLEGTILKPNMVIAGKKCANQAEPDEVAEWTVKLFKRCVPVAVPGIAFLSGGQSDVEATANLNAVNRLRPLPWAITFSYGRALQAAPQKAWSGKSENVVDAQKAFEHRARMNGLAAMGEWTRQFEAESQ
ncbi:MAG TPA: class I fructose-bisphosphate aldolase, partial [Beijerinckiaceae bacterium]|nr:class I fructose-bisphosphate aldolase [Beijerinckiaceae bacterium]